MFVVKFKYSWSTNFEVWTGLGQFNSVDKAKKSIEIPLKEIDDYTLQGCNAANHLFQIKFYDVSIVTKNHEICFSGQQGL